MADKVDAPTGSDAGSIAKADGAGPKAIIKNVDMGEEMQQEAVDVASAALEKYNIEKDIAAQIKKEFDKRHGPTWHVVVGKNFGSYVTHGPSPLFLSPLPLAYSRLLLPAMVIAQIARLSVLSCGWIELMNVSPETKHFIYFYIGSLAILIWKS